ncbi:unnamed protein product [Echinostoma caproni]|uniref:PH and SEC7 domain-containing protein 1-like n=1 Tax=Echinostoma caproni TaxID=27848 RepID=A0A183A8S3_9TREM|nr:unnamed protein product [Echinostoma caproni]
MRTVSDVLFASLENGRTDERKQRTTNTSIVTTAKFHHHQPGCHEGDYVPQVPSVRNKLDDKLNSVPDHLCSLSLHRDSSVHPDLSNDSVFQDDGPDQSNPGVNPYQRPGRVSYDSQPSDNRQAIPSTNSTEFSLSGSVIDTASQPDLCDSELNEKSTEGKSSLLLSA